MQDKTVFADYNLQHFGTFLKTCWLTRWLFFTMVRNTFNYDAFTRFMWNKNMTKTTFIYIMMWFVQLLWKADRVSNKEQNSTTTTNNTNNNKNKLWAQQFQG